MVRAVLAKDMLSPPPMTCVRTACQQASLDVAHAVGLQHPNHDTLPINRGAEDIYGCVATPHIFSSEPYYYLGTHNVWHMRYSNPY